MILMLGNGAHAVGNATRNLELTMLVEQRSAEF
jgi:hypothetical protein